MTTRKPTIPSSTNEPRPSPAVLRRIVELAVRAPSVGNTQPWAWRIVDAGLVLSADRGRLVRHSDPVGRNLVISCGAALHHAEIAANALGWEVTIDRVPYGPPSPVLAELSFTQGSSRLDAGDLILGIEERYTDRRRFTSWPVPEERLQHLVRIVIARGAHAVAVTDLADRFRVELLVSRAIDRQAPERRLRHQPPVSVAGTQDPDLAGSDGLLVLHCATDTAESWLRAGEGLSALWLHAAKDGLSVVPLSSVIEVAETRNALEQELLGGFGHPLLLVRVGWRTISRSELPRTTRRPVDDVLT